MSNVPNIRAVARREVTVRTRTRAYRFGTLVLLLGVVAIAFAPVIVRAIEGATTDRIAVYDGTGGTINPVATLTAVLNPPDADPDAAIVVVPVTDLQAGLGEERSGRLAGVLAITRGSSGDLSIRFHTDEGLMSRLPQLVAQAAATLTARTATSARTEVALPNARTEKRAPPPPPASRGLAQSGFNEVAREAG